MSYLLIITQIFLQSFQLVITVKMSEDEEYLLYEDGDILDNDGIEIDDLKVGQIFSCEDVAVMSIENWGFRTLRIDKDQVQTGKNRKWCESER